MQIDSSQDASSIFRIAVRNAAFIEAEIYCVNEMRTSEERLHFPHRSHNPELEELTAKTQLTRTFVGVSHFPRNELPDIRECPKRVSPDTFCARRSIRKSNLTNGEFG